MAVQIFKDDKMEYVPPELLNSYLEGGWVLTKEEAFGPKGESDEIQWNEEEREKDANEEEGRHDEKEENEKEVSLPEEDVIRAAAKNLGIKHYHLKNIDRLRQEVEESQAG